MVMAFITAAMDHWCYLFDHCAGRNVTSLVWLLTCMDLWKGMLVLWTGKVWPVN